MADTFKHNVEILGMGQPNEATCWHASFRMMFTYLNRTTAEVDPRLEAAGIDTKDAQRAGLADTEYQKAADALGFTGWSGKRFNLNPGLFDFGLSDGAEEFVSELRMGPLWVSRKTKGGYHAVVAVGYDDDAGKIIFNNPSPGPKNAKEERLQANLFVRNISAASASVQGWRYRV
jgi:hypothetical protein